MTATRAHNLLLPGVTAERTVPLGDELRRDDIMRDGVYVGQVVYVRRRLRRGGSAYGWRPAKTPRVALTDRVDAIRRLPAMVKP